MRLLGYVGTFNEPVKGTLEALRRQTQPVDGTVVVDNASTEDVLPDEFPEDVAVVRVGHNSGPNSAVEAGLRYGIEHGYDWMWLLESDGAPHDDALEKLVELIESFEPQERQRIGAVGSALVLLPGNEVFQGRLLTRGGMRIPPLRPELPYWEVDEILWNGCMFNLKAVREVGFPILGEGYWDDLCMDYGDTEYTWRFRRAGYRLLVHRSSLVDQRVGRSHSIQIPGGQITSTGHGPERRYLFLRNLTYFWLYIYPGLSWPRFLAWYGFRVAVTNLSILLLERNRLRQIRAGLRGIVDGWRGRIHVRYSESE